MCRSQNYGAKNSRCDGATAHFWPIFDEVAKENVPYVLMRGSKPEAALISYEAFLEFTAYQQKQAAERFEALAAEVERLNAEYSDEEVEDDIQAAIDEVRRLNASSH